MADIARLALMQLACALIMSPAISPDLDEVSEGYIKDFLMHISVLDGGQPHSGIWRWQREREGGDGRGGSGGVQLENVILLPLMVY